MSNIDNKSVEIYKAKTNEYMQKTAGLLPITSLEENAKVIEYKAELKKLGKEVKEEKEKATKPLNEVLKTVREWWSPLEKLIDERESNLEKLLLDYKHKIEDEARKKEAQIAARVEKGTMRLDTAERKLDELPKIQTTTHTAAGQVQFRKIPQMRIINEDLIPDEYWVIDLVKLRKDVIAGMVVPGAEKYYEERV